MIDNRIRRKNLTTHALADIELETIFVLDSVWNRNARLLVPPGADIVSTVLASTERAYIARRVNRLMYRLAHNPKLQQSGVLLALDARTKCRRQFRRGAQRSKHTSTAALGAKVRLFALPTRLMTMVNVHRGVVIVSVQQIRGPALYDH